MKQREIETKTDDVCSTKESQRRGVNRRQFTTNAGVLLGMLAVGEPALGEAPVAEAGKGAGNQKSASESAGTQHAPRLMARGIRRWSSCANGIRNGLTPAQR